MSTRLFSNSPPVDRRPKDDSAGCSNSARNLHSRERTSGPRKGSAMLERPRSVAALALVPTSVAAAAHRQHKYYGGSSPTNAAARSALVVDDDAFFRMTLGTILTTKLGYSKVIEAASFDEALERLSENANVSIALFDLSMPGGRTLADLRVIRENFPIVVVVSASNARSEVLKALEASVHGYVPKGLGIAALTAALKAVFEGNVFVPPLLLDISSIAEKPSLASAETSAAAPAATLNALTPRQRDVLSPMVQGKSNKEIARALNLGEGTVKIHVAALFRNLGVKSRVAAAVAGARLLSGG